MSKRFYYSGAIHIHSLNSDGTGNIESISKAAAKAGLSYIIITDHNYFDTEEGYYNGVCVIKGEEISPKNSANHYVSFGIKEYIIPDTNPKTNIENVKKQGGFGFAAHPDESDCRKSKNEPIKWVDKTLDVDGIEIWNWFSDWADSYDESNIFKIAYGYLFREKLITGANQKTLEWWDKINNEKANIVPAIGGVDSHALKISKYIIPVTIFPYLYTFKTVINTIITKKPLPEKFEDRKQIILNAIKKGSNIIINRKTHSKDFCIIKIHNETTEAFCGDCINLDDNTFLDLQIAVNAEIQILLNGKEYCKANGKIFSQKLTEKGKYRVQAFYKGKPCIYSNPILVI